jgi:acetoin utilization protein AcuB
MTPLPHMIGTGQSLACALERMAQLGIRHLPVVEGQKLAGILSERDIALLRAFGDVDPDVTTVSEAMTADTYVVAPDTPLASAVRGMAERRTGSAVVVDEDRVVGLLTTTDALSLLADLLSGTFRSRADGPTTAQVRDRIRNEHTVLRTMLDEAERVARRVLSGDARLGVMLVDRANELYATLLRHLELEDRILAPELRETDAYGPLRADTLLEGHRVQRTVLKEALAAFKGGKLAGHDLAATIRDLVPEVRLDMEREERELLNERVLTDELVARDHFVG